MQRENLPNDIDSAPKGSFLGYFHFGLSVTFFGFAIIFLLVAIIA